MKYRVIYQDNKQVAPTVISRHRTLDAAITALRRRNPHLFDASYARRHGMERTGTFDRIVDEAGETVDLATE